MKKNLFLTLFFFLFFLCSCGTEKEEMQAVLSLNNEEIPLGTLYKVDATEPSLCDEFSYDGDSYVERNFDDMETLESETGIRFLKLPEEYQTTEILYSLKEGDAGRVSAAYVKEDGFGIYVHMMYASDYIADYTVEEMEDFPLQYLNQEQNYEYTLYEQYTSDSLDALVTVIQNKITSENTETGDISETENYIAYFVKDDICYCISDSDKVSDLKETIEELSHTARQVQAELKLEDASLLSFEETENLTETLLIQTGTFPAADMIQGSFCVYGSRVYYEVNYYDMLIDQTGQIGNIPFEEKYNTQIRVYDTKTDSDELVYQYHEDGCLDISDIIFDGTYLIWEEVKDDRTVYMLDPTTQTQPQKLDLESQAVNPFTLCGNYDISLEKGDGTSSITIQNIDNHEKRTLSVKGAVHRPAANEYLCIWTEESGDADILYVYDFNEGKLSQIEFSPGRLFSYALLEHYVIANQRRESSYGKEGIYCFDLEEMTYEQLFSSEDDAYTFLFTFQGADHSVYFELADQTDKNKFAILSVK